MVLVLPGLQAQQADVNKSSLSAFPLSSFCKESGQVLSKGTQVPEGSCVSTIIGAVPSADRIPSSIIQFPHSRSTIDPSKDLNIVIQTINMATGFFAGMHSSHFLILKGRTITDIHNRSPKQVLLHPSDFGFCRAHSRPPAHIYTAAPLSIKGSLGEEPNLFPRVERESGEWQVLADCSSRYAQSERHVSHLYSNWIFQPPRYRPSYCAAG